jgi:alcohol dehydrogenase (cytochrome c)
MAMKGFRFVIAALALAGTTVGLAQSPLIDGKDLLGGLANPTRWLTHSGDYASTRHSPLKQITPENIGRLAPAWSFETGLGYGRQAKFEATPITIDGTLYVTGLNNHAWAIDGKTGTPIWHYERPLPVALRVCCGMANRGFAVHGGRLFMATLDAHVIALDAKTGKEVWKVKVDEWKAGFSMTMAPLIANGVLVTGMSGAEFGIRGYIDGWDPQTGKRLWRTYTIPGRGEKGNETWPQDNDAWKVGGGSSWITGSYDPELDLTYWGTGNPAPWASQSRPGDNLYTSSVLAIRPKTGEIAWYYQFTPNDPYDYDACWELINANITVEGQPRKVIMQLNRNGFMYVIDRTNGKLISAKPFEKVNWASHVDMTTGRPVETELGKKVRAREAIEHWPSARGAKNWPHAAFNPDTGLLYANTMHVGMMYKHLEIKPHVVGQRYMYMENLNMPRPHGQPIGHIEAINPLTGEKK